MIRAVNISEVCKKMNCALSEKLTNLVREAVSPGLTAISFALMKDGQELAAGAVGTRDGRPDHPARTSDLYNIGSVSKVYLTAAVMKLVEMGKIDLDAPVVQYLPRFKMPDPRYKDITVRMCLSHQSGLPGTHWKNSFSYAWLGEEYFEDVYDYFAHSRLKADPGAYTTYCNDGFTLAEMVAVEVSGMALPDFLRKYILVPLGALSTCASDRMPIGHDHIAAKAAPGVEYLEVVGSGGINSDMMDVCRFGNSFLTHSVLSAESCAEMAKPHGIPYPPQDAFSRYLGLGWDRVAFENSVCDLGEGTLMKSGGTTQFLSYLIVSPKYNLAAAISGTPDTNTDHMTLLCRLIDAALKEEGIDASLPATAVQHDFCDIPPEIKAGFEGFYASPTDIFQAEMSGDCLDIYNVTTGQKKPFQVGLRYCGDHFYGKAGQDFAFVEHDGTKYIFSSNNRKGFVPLLQKLENLKPLTEAWKKRDGRQYFFCDATPDDAFWGMSSAVATLKVFPQVEGLMLARLEANPDNGMPLVMPLAVENDNLSRMFLNASANASRDQFAAEFYEKDGSEEMYLCGMRYRDIAHNKQPLESGEIVAEYGKTLAFFIPEGKKPAIYVPDKGHVLLVSRDFHIVYDSYLGGEVPDVGGGYALFTGQTGARFSVVL